MGKGGTGTVEVDGKVVDGHPMPHSLPVTLMWSETFNDGVDTGTAMDDKDYQVPFRFTGTIDKVTYNPGPPTMTEAQMKEAVEMRATGRDKR